MDRKDWDFPVAIKDLKVVEGGLVRSHKATIDEETGEVLGLVTPRFQLIQNRDINQAIEEVKDDLGLSLVGVDICRRRTVTVFDYKLTDKHSVEVGGSQEPNDVIRFGIRFINSFDGFFGNARGSAYAERLVCTNGMMVPRQVGRFSLKHLGGFGPAGIREAIRGRIAPLVNVGHTWNDWAKMTPNRTKVGEFITGRLSKKVAEEILKNYDEGKDQSLWGLYNLVTYYITHQAKVRNPNNIVLKQMELQKTAGDFYSVDFN